MLSLQEIFQRMKKLPNWSVESGALIREFSFNSFTQSMSFVNKVAEVAEKEQHHPTILIDYGSVKISLTTHEEKSLSEKDFLTAEKIDEALGEILQPENIQPENGNS